MLRKFVVSMLMVSGLAGYAAAEPMLTIYQNGKETKFTRQELLGKHTYQLNVTNDRAYSGKNMQYTAVRICDLLKPFNVKSDQSVEFVSSDDFYAVVPAKHLVNCKKGSSIGYVAIEPADKPWPKLKYNNPDADAPDHGTAGPFYIVWTDPEHDYISNEYWAWKIVRMNILKANDLGGVIPPPQNVKQAIRNGYHVYATRCSGCHTMNKIGKAKVGPDLNYPMSVTSYFASDKILKQFIRDPQSVRKMPNDRMSGTSKKFMSDTDLDDLIQYLHYMDKQRQN